MKSLKMGLISAAIIVAAGGWVRAAAPEGQPNVVTAIYSMPEGAASVVTANASAPEGPANVVTS